MLIRGDDIYKLISNDMIMLGTCFSMFVYISFCCFVLIGGNLTAQSMQSHRGIGDRIQNSRDKVASSPSISCPAARVPRRACPEAIRWTPLGLTQSVHLIESNKGSVNKERDQI